MSSASLLPLLRMSIAAQTEGGDAPQPRAAEVKPMSKEDQAWLSAAMAELSKNPVDEMKKLVAVIKGDAPDEVLEALQNLVGFVEHIDLARDLHKIGGLEPVIRLVRAGANAQVRAAACHVLAVTTANNPEPQQVALDMGALPAVCAVLADAGATTTEKAKAIFAISSLVRHNDMGYVEFVNKLHGFKLLHAVLETHAHKDGLPARRKAAFLLEYLVARAPVTAKPMAPSFVPTLRACLEADAEDEAFGDHARNVLAVMVKAINA